MEKRFFLDTCIGVSCFVFFCLFATPVLFGAETPSGSDLPDSLKPHWEDMQKGLRHEYEVCKEHCGTSRPCLDRCEKAYQSRTEQEYRRMLSEKPPMEGAAGQGTTGKQGDETEEKWGVRPLHVRLSASDHFLDFRYRVTDSKKAETVLSRKEKAFLIHEKTGKVFSVPVTKLGPLRATAVEPKEDRNYAILFGNPDKSITKGDRVTVVIGEYRAEHLTVE